ncbi:MAG: hypothetical protein AAGE98_04170 [Actinomycetota bacterium]
MRGALRRWGTLLITFAVLASACGGGGDDEQQIEAAFTLPRTYEKLDLSGPEAAVAEFTSAFIRRDYVTAALILHPDTQRSMAISVAADDVSGFVAPEAAPTVLARIAVERGGDEVVDAARVFEVAMEEAMSNGGFSVDLASGVEGVTLRTSDQFGAVVDGILSTNGLDVVFELAPASDGRWRIRGVRLSNGTPLQVPFSGTPSQMSLARNTEPRDVWRTTLPNASPQELLDTIVTLVDAQDHVSLYLLLDATGQRGVADQLAALTIPDHGLPAPMLDARFDEVGFPVDFTGVESIPADTLTTAENVGPGEAITFAVTVETGDLDVTMARDSTGAWRLRRMVPVGELTAPTPFVVG